MELSDKDKHDAHTLMLIRWYVRHAFGDENPHVSDENQTKFIKIFNSEQLKVG